MCPEPGSVQDTLRFLFVVALLIGWGWLVWRVSRYHYTGEL